MAHIFTIDVPFSVKGEDDIIKRWEAYLNRCHYPFKKKSSKDTIIYVISIESPQDAYWIGCNQVALINKLFDGPLTKTLA